MIWNRRRDFGLEGSGSVGLVLCYLALMDQASVLDGLCFDLLPFYQDCWAAPEVNVGRCQIADL